jgi:hypothetical protein
MLNEKIIFNCFVKIVRKHGLCSLTDIFIGRNTITSEKVVTPQAEDKILVIIKYYPHILYSL